MCQSNTTVFLWMVSKEQLANCKKFFPFAYNKFVRLVLENVHYSSFIHDFTSEYTKEVP